MLVDKVESTASEIYKEILPEERIGYPEWYIHSQIQTKGTQSLFASLLSDLIRRPQIDEARRLFHRRNALSVSDEVEDFFEFHRARSFVQSGSSFQVQDMDDRCGENMDIAMALYDLSTKVDLPREINKPERRLALAIKNAPEAVYTFLVRTPSEHLKLLYYYCGIRSFAEVGEIFELHDTHKGDLSMHRTSFEDPIEFIAGLHPVSLEALINRLNIKSKEEYKKFLFAEPYLMAFLRDAPSDLLDYLMERLEIDSVGKLITFTKEQRLRENLTAIKDQGAHKVNLIAVMRKFDIKDSNGIEALFDKFRILSLARKASPLNFQILLDLAQPARPEDLEILAENEFISTHIQNVDYSRLLDFLKLLGLSQDRLDRYSYEIIRSSYTRELESIITDLDNLWQQAKMPDSLTNFILEVLIDEDYLEQNLMTIDKLLQYHSISTDSHVSQLNNLKLLMGGFITPQLSRKYLAASTDAERQKVVATYQSLMQQVLSSGQIEVEDTDLLSEIIYLAYRPTGFTVDRIADLLRYQNLIDYTDHLSKLSFTKEGYDMQFRLTGRVQRQEFDKGLLRQADLAFLTPERETPTAEYIATALSAKPEHIGVMPLLINRILRQLDDQRIIAYDKANLAGSSTSAPYTQERLDTLLELLTVIPTEDTFEEMSTKILTEDPQTFEAVKSAVDRYLWFMNKARLPKPERAAKTKMDEIIGHLSKDINADVAAFFDSPELTVLGKEAIEAFREMGNSELLAALSAEVARRFLGYDISERANITLETFRKAMSDWFLRQRAVVKKELRKIETFQTDEFAQVRAVLSKNVGSYFAKAGADICTMENMNMWREDRHYHLNLIYKNQIIGNVMVYFEPERDYMIVRGVNPRNDVMVKFDRRSMAEGIVGVLDELARQNGYREIFMTDQEWFALSNREGMAKELFEISRRNSRRAQEKDPTQRVVIEDANFYATEVGGVKIDNLLLLSTVEH